MAAKASAFQFKGESVDIKQVGAARGVSTVLTGSVRWAGKRLRVTAQLTNVVDGYELWSQKYDRVLDDVFAIQALEEAVEIYPEYAAAWTFLRQARLQAGDVAGARAALEKAFEPLVRVAASQQDWVRASEVVGHALKLVPGDTRMRWFRRGPSISWGIAKPRWRL